MLEPKVRFKRDDGNSYSQWEEVALGDIATRITRKNSNGETDRPLTIASIEGLVDQRNYFGKTVASKDLSGYFLLKNGEYAYNKSYSAGFDYGSIKRLDKYDMGALSTLYICFALNNDQNSDFYNCYFNGLSWYNQMGEICAEGARNHGLLNVSATEFFKIKMSVPTSQEEQQKIADFLSSIDEVIAASEQEVANLETQKKAVMKIIFSQEVRFKREDGTDFPEWVEARFGDTVIIERGGSPRPIENYLTEGEGLNWIKIGDAPQYGNYITQTAQRIIPEGLRKTRQVFVGDLILSNSMSFGKPYIMGINGCIHDGWLLIRNNQDRYNLIYLCFLLGSDYMLKQYKSLAGGSAVNNLNKDLVAGTTVFIPCLEEQHLIADFLSDFDEVIAAAKKELELWKELKKGLLQQMFV